MDVHKQETQVCIEDATGAVVLEQRIRTTRERLTALCGGRPPARILLEAATESEWVAQHLEGLGHEVIVADPNYAAMYATRSRRGKTDRRDARTLADACRLGAYRAAHGTSAAQREVRAALAVREALVRTRTRYLSVIRAVLRREGIRVPSGSAVTFGRRLAQGVRSPTQARVVAPLVELLAPLNAAIAAADAGMARRVAADPVARRLATTPGVGPVTAVAFRATLDDVGRFARPGQVAAYLGLVPCEHSSGGTAPARGGDEGGEHARALVAGPGGMGRLARSSRGLGPVGDLGRGARGPPGQGHRGGGAGPPPRGHPLRPLARRHDLRPGARRPCARSGTSTSLLWFRKDGAHRPTSARRRIENGRAAGTA